MNTKELKLTKAKVDKMADAVETIASSLENLTVLESMTVLSSVTSALINHMTPEVRTEAHMMFLDMLNKGLEAKSK